MAKPQSAVPDEQEPAEPVYEPDDDAGAEEETEEKEEPSSKQVRIKPDEDGGVTVEVPKARRKDKRESRTAAELRQLREEREQYRREAAELRLQQQRYQQPVYQAPQQQVDPYQQEIDNIRAEQETIQLTLRSGALNDVSAIERAKQRFYQLDDRARQVERERIRREVVDEVRRDQGSREGEHEIAILKAEFPDVISNPAAFQYSRGEYYRLIAKGEPGTLETYRKAMTEAAYEFSLRQRAMPKVTPAHQQRYGGVAAQAGVKQSSGGYHLNKDQMKMAVHRWPDDDEKVAYAKMAALMQQEDEE